MPSFRLVDLSLSTPPAFDRSQKASFLLVGFAGCDKHMTQAELDTACVLSRLHQPFNFHTMSASPTAESNNTFTIVGLASFTNRRTSPGQDPQVSFTTWASKGGQLKKPPY